jgi:hypothetical protein
MPLCWTRRASEACIFLIFWRKNCTTWIGEINHTRIKKIGKCRFINEIFDPNLILFSINYWPHKVNSNIKQTIFFKQSLTNWTSESIKNVLFNYFSQIISGRHATGSRYCEAEVIRACLTYTSKRVHPVKFRRDRGWAQFGLSSRSRIPAGPYRPNTAPSKPHRRPLQIHGGVASEGPTPHSQP